MDGTLVTTLDKKYTHKYDLKINETNIN